MGLSVIKFHTLVFFLPPILSITAYILPCNEFVWFVQYIKAIWHSALFLVPSNPILVIFKFCSMRRFQWVQKLLYWFIKIQFYDTCKFPSIFQNWNILKLGFVPHFKNSIKFGIFVGFESCRRSVWLSQCTMMCLEYKWSIFEPKLL